VRQALKALSVPETEESIDSMSSPFFSFAVTKEAVYLTTNKDVARFPLSAIRRVALDPARGLPAGTVLNGATAFMLLTGVILHLSRLSETWELIAYFLLATTYISSLVPMMRGYRGRYRLWVDLSPDFAASSNDFEPPPEAVASPKKKAAALEAQTRFLDACKRAGLWVIDNRSPTKPS
jgi:hypothetical protein